MADLTVTVADVKRGAGAVVERHDAGVALTAGQPVYLDSDGKLKLAIALGGSVASAKVRGVTLSAALANQPVEIQTDGRLAGMGTTEGVSYLLSTVAGGISPHTDATTPATTEFNSNIGVGGANGDLLLAIFNSEQQVA